MSRNADKGYYDSGRYYPAINVKHRARLWISAELQKKLDNSGQEDHLTNRAYERTVEAFWEMAREDAAKILGPKATVTSLGRSGGWLGVAGIGEPEEFDAKTRRKWEKFVTKIEGLLGTVDEMYENEVRDVLEDAGLSGTRKCPPMQARNARGVCARRRS